MAQHGRGRPDAMSSYSSSEIYRASNELSKDIAHGALHFLQTAFEYYPLEAVPNVWEGDEGMMKHVPPFPMPPCVALPEQPDFDAVCPTARVDSTCRVHLHDGRSKAPEVHGQIDLGDYGFQKKQQVMERKFWIHMAKLSGSLDALSLGLVRMASRFSNQHENVRKKAAQQLADIYSTMRKIKLCIQRAEVRHARYGFSNQCQVMPLSKKLTFKQQHLLKGELPLSVGNVEKKFLDVRDKMGQIARKNWKKLSPFQDIVNRVMKDVSTKCNLFRDGIFQCLDDVAEDGEEAEKHLVSGENAESDMLYSGEELDESHKMLTENVAWTGESDRMSKEDRFWETMTNMKVRMQRTARTLQVLDKMKVQSKNVSKASAVYRQMLSSRAGIRSFEDTLMKLKKEMETEHYEDRKLFSEENLTSLGIKGLTPDNSLNVVETWLQKLKDEYFKIRNKKSALLKTFGYEAQVGFDHPRIDRNMKLVRVCAHSKSVISAYNFVRVKKGSSETNQKEANEEGVQTTSSLDAGTSSQQHAEADIDHHSNNPIVSEAAGGDVNTSEDVSLGKNATDGDGTPTGITTAGQEDDASDDSSAEDISRTVNTMSFFLRSFGTSALTVNEPSSAPVSEDFIEKEKQYWDKLQKLLRKIDKTGGQLTKIAHTRQRYYGQKVVKSALQPLHMRMKDLLKNYESENVEGRRCGYCRNVTYENEEQLPDGFSNILVKNLDQIKNRIDAVWGQYIATAKNLGVPFSYKI